VKAHLEAPLGASRKAAAFPLANLPLVFAIVICAFVPVVAISAMTWLCADMLQDAVPHTNLAASANVLWHLSHPSPEADSWAPMLQALHMFGGPNDNRLYEVLFFEEKSRFQYPPTSLLSLDFLAGFGLARISYLNAINSLVFLLNSIFLGYFAWRLFRDEQTIRWKDSSLASALPVGIGLLAAGATFVFYPVVRAHVLGQIQIWIDFLFTLVLIAWLLERRLLAGLLVGIACTIKPQLGLLLVWGLLWREWVFSGGTIAVLASAGIASLFRYGMHNHFSYLDVLSFLSSHGESYFANNSVNGILHGYFAPVSNLAWTAGVLTPYHPIVHAGTIVASVLALAIIVIPPLLRRRAQPTIADLGTAAICTVVGSPVAWEHHYGILLPLYVVALKGLLERPANQRYGLLAALALSWILVANYISFANLAAGTLFSVLQAYLFFGALLLLALLLSGVATPAALQSPSGRAPFRPRASGSVAGA
jgi:hypothetical protein